MDQTLVLLAICHSIQGILMSQITGAYNANDIESKWTKYWFEEELFNLEVKKDRPTFSAALPPPNITGNLHMGHALNGTLQDILIRTKRMQGYNVLWQPGTDHAGISTQMVVERQLKKEGKSRHDLGREKFIERCFQWRHEYGNNIFAQYKRLGVSFTWNRLAFTMDEDYVKAIYRAFKILFQEGYIYRGNRVTNWCPRCLTSLSDLEVVHEETQGHLYHIKYKIAESKNEFIVVATTRPETMFGDVAVAVNPKDSRYKNYIGKKAILPLTTRTIPIIADDYVDMEFGTGALKITPAHDANDFEIGQKHKLEQPIILSVNGKLLESDLVPQQFQNIERFSARKAIIEELEQSQLLDQIKDYANAVSHCERCHTAIEPYLSEQWYVTMKDLAKSAIDIVEEGRIVFIPERYTSAYLDRLKNERDWCISRQLWWGHRIPIWTCTKCKHIDAYETPPTSCPKCNNNELSQDNDVLDTWFSSALWPFATLGWPDKTNELKTFYPTTVLSTAREIISLWVARMIFTSLKFVGTIPFKQVLIHPVIQTADGKRMSKSKGNAIDPIDMIEKYGADANRFWFASLGVKGDQDVRFREDRLDEYKRFVNKLWNAGRFVLTQLGDYQPKAIDSNNLSLADRFILHRYASLLTNLNNQINNYDFNEMAKGFIEFIWDDFCDWYLEISKIQTSQSENNSQTLNVLYTIFEGLLRALHPIMPFVTEELWDHLPKSQFFTEFESIMFAPYPRSDERFIDHDANKKMDIIIRVIRAIRNIRQIYNVPASAEADVAIYTNDNEETSLIENQSVTIKKLARIGKLSINPPAFKDDSIKASEIISSITINVPLANLIDVSKTKTKLTQRQDSILKDLQKVQQVLENQDFKTKAPQDKVLALESQLNDLEKQKTSIESQLKVLETV
jgi:valyl-tRNA synthetase